MEQERTFTKMACTAATLSGSGGNAANACIFAGTAAIVANTITAVVHTGASDSFSVLATNGAVFDADTTVDVVVGSTTVLAANVFHTLKEHMGDVDDAISFDLYGNEMYGTLSATALNEDLVNVQITLTEFQRNNAQRSSQYPGGDGHAMKIQISFAACGTSRHVNSLSTMGTLPSALAKSCACTNILL